MGSLGQTEAGAGSSKVLAVHALLGGHCKAGAGSSKVLAVRASSGGWVAILLRFFVDFVDFVDSSLILSIPNFLLFSCSSFLRRFFIGFVDSSSIFRGKSMKNRAKSTKNVIVDENLETIAFGPPFF